MKRTQAVKERPILFSAPMVRAILDGRKTQTRRVVKPAPDWKNPGPCSSETPEGWQGPLDYSLWAHEGDKSDGCLRRCPYGVPGDRLWVRESLKAEGDFMVYAADGGRIDCGDMDWPSCTERRKIIPSIHLPRLYSRITLEVVNVRVERLNEISEADASAEGIAIRRSAYGIYECQLPDGKTHFDDSAVDLFKKLWESINSPGSWDENPWVWVVEFRRVL